MIEQVGLLDVFAAMKRYKRVIIVVLLLTLVLSGASAFSKLSSARSADDTDSGSALYISSCAYSIEPTVPLNRDNSTIYQSYPSQFAAALNSDFCKNYVLAELLKSYSAKDIISKTVLSEDSSIASADDLNINHLEKIFFAEQYKNTMMLHITSESFDDTLSKDILKSVQRYLVEQYAPNITDVEIKYLESIYHQADLSDSIILSKDENKEQKTSVLRASSQNSAKSIIIKSMIVPLIAVFVLLFVAIFAIAFLRPTLNRKSDFLAYDVPVIGELFIQKNLKEEK